MWIISAAIVLVLAATCAALGQFVSGYSRGGCPVSFVFALVGVIVGPMAAQEMGQSPIYVLPIDKQNVDLGWGAIGALVLVLMVNLFTHRRKF